MIYLADDSGLRIDKWLAEQQEEGLSRSYIQKLIAEGCVLINGLPAGSHTKISEGDEIELRLPDRREPDILPEDIPLDILYEDADVILVNKPKGMVVHPAPGHYSGTLVNALLWHCRDSLSGINGIARPGIVHRIDKDTTGVIIACKNDAAHASIAEQLKEHSIVRRYRALVSGTFSQDSGTISANIGRSKTDRKKMAVVREGGRTAVTHYQVLQRFRDASYIECRLETGRTHQIRVHMASIGHPLLGDTVYGNAGSRYHLQGQCLHAMVLGFIHPSTGEYMEFSADLPEYFENLLNIL